MIQLRNIYWWQRNKNVFAHVIVVDIAHWSVATSNYCIFNYWLYGESRLM